MKTSKARSIVAVLAYALPTYVSTAYAERVSAVRQAAIEKMQSKLGTIRGSIDPDDRHIYLTEGMIERLKPIRPGTTELRRAVPISNGQTASLAGDDDRNLTTNSVSPAKVQGTLPDTTDLDAIMKAIDTNEE